MGCRIATAHESVPKGSWSPPSPPTPRICRLPTLPKNLAGGHLRSLHDGVHDHDGTHPAPPVTSTDDPAPTAAQAVVPVTDADADTFVSPADAAAMLGCSEASVRRLGWDGTPGLRLLRRSRSPGGRAETAPADRGVSACPARSHDGTPTTSGRLPSRTRLPTVGTSSGPRRSRYPQVTLLRGRGGSGTRSDTNEWAKKKGRWRTR